MHVKVDLISPWAFKNILYCWTRTYFYTYLFNWVDEWWWWFIVEWSEHKNHVKITRNVKCQCHKVKLYYHWMDVNILWSLDMQCRMWWTCNVAVGARYLRHTYISQVQEHNQSSLTFCLCYTNTYKQAFICCMHYYACFGIWRHWNV